MPDREKLVGEIFETMRSLANRSFPLECSCGKMFYNLDEFLEQTLKPEGDEHGLFEPTEYDDPSITNLLRTCPVCGSTLMAVFKERRDTSEHGARVRALFQELLSLLRQRGVSDEKVRTELLKSTRGADSPFLRKKLLDTANGALDQIRSLLDTPRP